ncbi:TspO/MBR family protein [Sphingomonas fuzhouensis]|uniref:TspO/MBR family protein n=1 Tax=Sphingomonas fuzhouensis TaxID=3106033 RepID=UPI002AFF1E3E|nr:TspO/MBR family protein [Sphingomonas sp. SGZ-02]
MGKIASKGQLRMSFLRWAIVIVPLILLLGFASGRSVPSGAENSWYRALAKPELTPPGWVFPVAWTTLYILIGLALAMIVHARGAKGRGVAIGLFAVQFALNLAWTPLFFGAHRVGMALVVIVAILLLSIVTTVAFSRIRKGAAWLMVPYLVWLSFAGVLNWRIGQLNPDAERLVPGAQTSQML